MSWFQYYLDLRVVINFPRNAHMHCTPSPSFLRQTCKDNAQQNIRRERFITQNNATQLRKCFVLKAPLTRWLLDWCVTDYVTVDWNACDEGLWKAVMGTKEGSRDVAVDEGWINCSSYEVKVTWGYSWWLNGKKMYIEGIPKKMMKSQR